jgi:hypothetical protein
MKKERSFRVLLENIYPSINLKQLKQKINSKDHAIINMDYMIKNYKKNLIHIFREIKTNS